MKTSAIVVGEVAAYDVLELGGRSLRVAMDHVGLHRVEEGFDQSVVRHCLRAVHALDDPTGEQAVAIEVAAVLAAAI